MVTSCTTPSYVKHLTNPFCLVHPTQAKATQIFYLCVILGVVYGVYRALSDRTVAPKKETSLDVGSSKYSEEQIRKLAKIEISFETLEKRVKASKYLDSYDTIKRSLQKSWEQADKLGVSHSKIADFLMQFCEQCRVLAIGSSIPVELEFELSWFTEGPQSVIVRRVQNVMEKDIFSPKDEEEISIFAIEIYNPKVQAKVIWTPMRGAFIRNHGFYAREITFLSSMQVLTGKTLEQLSDILNPG